MQQQKTILTTNTSPHRQQQPIQHIHIPHTFFVQLLRKVEQNLFIIFATSATSLFGAI